LSVEHIPCGDFANESERNAVERLKIELSNTPGRWIILSNVPHAVTSQAVPDDVDLFVIGPTGLHVVEVKYWDRVYLKDFLANVTHEADKLCNKVRRVASKLKQAGIDAGFLAGKLFLTKGTDQWISNRPQIHGCEVFGIKEGKRLLDTGGKLVFQDAEVDQVCQLLQPLSRVVLKGEVRNIASARNLERLSDSKERFHRVFRGEHIRTRDKIILHLYDLSASDDPNADRLASRQFESLQKLQRLHFVPRLMDSFQEVPHYPGELWYFSVVDPCAPPIKDRANDKNWSIAERIEFSLRAVKALKEIHSCQMRDTLFVHRNINTSTMLIGAGNQPIYTAFDLARISESMTLSPSLTISDASSEFAAPETTVKGLGAADQRSDTYSLCKSLSCLFSGSDEARSIHCLDVLQKGTTTSPNERISLEALANSFAAVLSESSSGQLDTLHTTTLSARYWSEGDLVVFNNEQFRVAGRIGIGSYGSTFKVIQVENGQDVGVYAGKVMFEKSSGDRALNAYRRVRSHTDQPHLATVFASASQWEENRFVALMQWVEGSPLQNWIGLPKLYAEELGETQVEVVGRWIRSCCLGLRSLHRANLVHGDVSIKNIIEHAGDVTLVDFDSVLQDGEPIWSAGTVLYTPREQTPGNPARCSHDVYSLAAAIFHVMFDREPFWYGGERRPENGLNWEGLNRLEWDWISDFLTKATAPSIEERFKSGIQALQWIEERQGAYRAHLGHEESATASGIKPAKPDGGFSETSGESNSRSANRVLWLAELQSTYPGSPRGGKETRGLDSRFAHETYVETSLEQNLLDEIKTRNVQLVILCGNAGDGKTAFLQHLAGKLGVGVKNSSERVAKGSAFGLSIKINLDGAASFRGKSADELLSDLFEPFQNGPSDKPRLHLVAVNDGRLLQWAEDYEASKVSTPLTEWIIETLIGENASDNSIPHIRLVNLNQRSLVGDARTIPKTDEEKQSWQPSTEFFNSLLDRMLGGEKVNEIWMPCQTCTAAARCTSWHSVRTLTATEGTQRDIAGNIRNRLAEAFQAVHQRGQVHITTRELRGALSYILFGVHFCDDLHAAPEVQSGNYWDRAFAADSDMRQGDLLGELQRLDPAFGSNPTIDRYLRSHDPVVAPDKPPRFSDVKSLISRRRRAYFEWLRDQSSSITSDDIAVPLFQSHGINRFRNVAIMSHEERSILTSELCNGISRLEQLPSQVLRRKNVVPFKTLPRTPVETTFWVEKPLNRFRLEVDSSGQDSGVEWLANGLLLIYEYKDGREERLRLESDLFCLLLDLAEGYQLMDSANDDVFTNLSIFTQRLAQEDEKVVFAWNPSQPDDDFRISSQPSQGVQRMCFESLAAIQEGSKETQNV